MQGLWKAFKLEIKHIKESKLHLLLLFIIPIVVIAAFASAGRDTLFDPEAGLSFYDFFAPQIFSTAIIFITIQLTVLRIVAERAPYGTLDRDLLAISRTGMFFGKYLANIVIAVFQCILIFLVGKSVYDVKIVGDSSLLFVLMVLTALLGLAMGMFFSIVAKTKDQAIQLVPFSVLILLVLSGIMVPLYAMPSSLREVASNLPLTLSYKSLEDVMLHGKNFQDILDGITKLCAWIIGLLVLGIIKFVTEKR